MKTLWVAVMILLASGMVLGQSKRDGQTKGIQSFRVYDGPMISECVRVKEEADRVVIQQLGDCNGKPWVIMPLAITWVFKDGCDLGGSGTGPVLNIKTEMDKGRMLFSVPGYGDIISDCTQANLIRALKLANQDVVDPNPNAKAPDFMDIIRHGIEGDVPLQPPVVLSLGEARQKADRIEARSAEVRWLRAVLASCEGK